MSTYFGWCGVWCPLFSGVPWCGVWLRDGGGLDCGIKQKNGRLTFRFSAQDETRTHTGLRPPPPQSGVSTNFTTWAIPFDCECKGSNNF